MHLQLMDRHPAGVLFAFGLAIAAGPTSAQQDYPSKSIRFIVGVAPGGATDILARAIGA